MDDDTKPSLVSRLAGIWSYGWILAFCIIPFVMFVFLKSTQQTPPFSDPTPWGVSTFTYVSHQWIAIVSSVAFFGGLGATVSFFSRSEAIDEAFIRPKTVGGSQIFGIIFAIILFLTFLGGLVQGSLFPQLASGNGWSGLSFDIDNWAKLMVWSFVAGFSERFVPDILFGLVVTAKRGERSETTEETIPVEPSQPVTRGD